MTKYRRYDDWREEKVKDSEIQAALDAMPNTVGYLQKKDLREVVNALKRLKADMQDPDKRTRYTLLQACRQFDEWLKKDIDPSLALLGDRYDEPA